jgi:hypothetical protein
MDYNVLSKDFLKKCNIQPLEEGDWNNVDGELFTIKVSEASLKEIEDFAKEYQKIPVSQKDRVFFQDQISYTFRKCKEILTSYHKDLESLKILSIEFQDDVLIFYMSRKLNHPVPSVDHPQESLVLKIIPIIQ